ncbi:MAG: hypothetical protein GC190_16350 [Alphaproteobacteria bacterium]|nr:hypothetical protein [Alphaproteobacteria bacterium]
MLDRGQRETPARIEALIQAALASDHGRRKIADAHAWLNAQAGSGKLSTDSVLEKFKRQVDIAVSHQLSGPSEFAVRYHAYAASGLAVKAARRLAEEFLSRTSPRR